MSVHVTSWARRLRLGKGKVSAKAVLLLLADNANDDGQCWPGVARLADEMCMSERSIRMQIDFLEQAGILSRYRRDAGFSRRLTNGFTLHIELTQDELNERIERVSEVGKEASDALPATDAASASETAENALPATVAGSADGAVDNPSSRGPQAETDAPQPANPGRAYKEEPSFGTVNPPHVLPSSSWVKEEDEDEDDYRGSERSVGIGEALQTSHPSLSLEALARRLAASGVAAAGIDLVAAATEVLDAKRGQRVGDPTAYVAASIVKEPWRWALPEGRAASAATQRASAARCTEGGEHRWMPDGTCLWCVARPGDDVVERSAHDGLEMGGAA